MEKWCIIKIKFFTVLNPSWVGKATVLFVKRVPFFFFTLHLRSLSHLHLLLHLHLLSVVVAGVLIFVSGVCLVYLCVVKVCGFQCPKRVRTVLVLTQSRQLKEDLESYARKYNPDLRLTPRRRTTPTNQVKFNYLESDLFSLFISTPP